MWLDLAWWRNSHCHSVGWRSDYEGHLSDYEGHVSKDHQQRIQEAYSLVLFIKPHEKPWKRKHSSNWFVSHHFFSWGWNQEFIDFDLQLDEESDFLHDVALQENRALLSSMTAKICFKMLMKSLVDHFPSNSNRVFNWKLTNFEVGFILQPIFFRLQSNCEA